MDVNNYNTIYNLENYKLLYNVIIKILKTVKKTLLESIKICLC